ncbi:hypothetical protein GOODEAATRI_006295 [Goodea atripinnis]|uniref:NAD(+) ADP-ribosyltransferase n=1 Tax=Goodea atripinnis TaxID=208336 RepID=A0ABV0PVR0_9TELE
MSFGVSADSLLLLRACDDGDYETARGLLEPGAPRESGRQSRMRSEAGSECAAPDGVSLVSVDCTDEEGNTGLQFASASGHENLVRFLLRKGASVDSRNNYGWTPLMQAARFGHLTVAHILLENGAEINGRNRLGASVLSMAARGGHVHVVKLLLESGAYVDDFDHLAVAADAISNGNNNNSCSTTGFGPAEGYPVGGGGGGRDFMDVTALMVASQHGHEATVCLLLEWGSDVNFSQKTTGWGPLMAATLSGKLVERGADPDRVNVLSKTSFELAMQLKQRDIKAYLDSITTVRPQTVLLLSFTDDERKRPDVFSKFIQSGWSVAPHDGSGERAVGGGAADGGKESRRRQTGLCSRLDRFNASHVSRVDKDKPKQRGRALISRSKSRQSLNNIPMPPDDKGGLKLTHTLRHGLSTNRLAPFPDDAETPLDATMRADAKAAAVANGTAGATAVPGVNDMSNAWAVKTKDADLHSNALIRILGLIVTLIFVFCKFPSIPKGPSSSSPSNSGHYHSPHSSGGSNGVAGINRDSHNRSDELSSILKKLSLEKYQPIFEEQEVDMEAFLTLTDGDLKELGIKTDGPRQQILAAISELNAGKVPSAHCGPCFLSVGLQSFLCLGHHHATSIFPS